MKRLTGSAIMLIIFSFYSFVQSQQFKKFSGKPETFTSEINELLVSPKEDELKNIKQNFSVNWDSSKFSSQEKEKILQFASCFIEKKIRTNPDFYNLLKTLNIFLEKEHPKASFEQWLNAIIDICNNRKTTASKINGIITHAYTLLTEYVIFQSPSLVWKPSSKSFYFKYDKELYIIFDNTDLVCYSKRDSINIIGTSGAVRPATMQWFGKKGMVTWQRAGYKPEIILAKLANYIIDLTKSSYSADSVSFTNKTYFDAPLLGHLEDEVTLISNPASATFPKFDSYKKHFIIKALYPNVNYEGGFSMQGAKLVGKGNAENPARLDFFRNDTLRLKAFSQYFIFRPEKVIGVDATISIYLDKDSIYHGDLQLTYTVKNKEILLNKSENYTAQSPYLDSYHKIDMNFEQLHWHIDEPLIQITTTPGTSLSKAIFESVNFFNSKEYSDLQYYDDNNPLNSLKKYSHKIDSTKFSAIGFAHYMNRTIEQIHVLLFPLAVKGYIFYNSAEEIVELKDRLFNYIKANSGVIDYDVIRLVSSANAPLENASIDLRNNDLKINGMPLVHVSDSQNVVFQPKNGTLLMKRNRSFQFDGTVQAGLFTFFGRNFFFNYDEFKVVLKNVDSVRIKVVTGYDLYNSPILQEVHNIIQDVTGEVLIDKPENKSGLKNNSEFPIFHSYGNSYVYYDDPSIFNGVYKRSRDFYFQIYPYTFDSLDNFKKENMRFDGQFLSAKIFPAIPEKLLLQPDYSLGFTHTTSYEGLPIYENKGRFYDKINLSNQGIKCDGRVDYLSSKIKSDNILFFPDSMNTTASEFTLEARAQFPRVNGQNIYIHWQPYNDKMHLSNTDKPFNMINNETTLNGSLKLEPKGLSGSGTMDMKTAVASSKKFNYGYNTIDADTSSFQLRSLHKEGFTVLTSNVKAHIDFGNRTGTFKSNDTSAITEFPENKYIAQLDEFKWKMDMQELEMISKKQVPASTVGEKYGYKDEPLTGSKYISTKSGQDSLSFVSPQAVYDYSTNHLNAKQVKYIDVADARIFPNNGNVSIEANAKMVPFVNAKITANTETRFHNIYEANVNIESKHKYTGSGKYDYIDENNKIETIIFNSINVDTSKQTIAQGEIVEPDSFTLSPNFLYQGKVKLTAKSKYMTFDGAVHIVDNCPNYERSWFMFESEINPINIIIPVNQKLVELNRRPIILGSLITTDSIHIYSGFFGVRKNHSDTLIATANGQLIFNKDTSTYLVAANEKLKTPMVPGPLVSINRNTCIHHNEGKINFGVNLGKLKITSAGNVDHDLNKNAISLHLMIGFNFFMHNLSMQAMGKLVDSLTLGNQPVDITTPQYKRDLGNIVDSNKLKKYYDELALMGFTVDIPEILSSTLFLNDVKLIWDDASNSYRSVGKIGIGYIFKHKINKYVEGYIEIWRKRTGDICDIYLKIDDKTFYYFGYTRGTMQVLSSDNIGFNDPIRKLRTRKRTLKTKRKDTPYSFLVSPVSKMDAVIKRWIDFQGPVNNEQIQQEQLPKENQKQPNDSIPGK